MKKGINNKDAVKAAVTEKGKASKGFAKSMAKAGKKVAGNLFKKMQKGAKSYGK